MKLCIDPGHGFANRRPGVYDPGAMSFGHAEADIALQWALTGKWVLTRGGIAVWLTRDDDSDPDPVGTRDDRAEAAGCTHFLSLHCNAADTGLIHGTETFYRDEADRKWAKFVQNAALAALGGHDRGVKPEGDSQHNRLAVFDFDGPCALLELGFITNPMDRQQMLLRTNRVKFWQLVLAELTNAWKPKPTAAGG